MSIGCLVAWVLVGFGPVVAFSPVPSQYYLTPNPKTKFSYNLKDLDNLLPLTTRNVSILN